MAYLSSVLTRLKSAVHRHRRERNCIGAHLFILAAPGLIYFLLGSGPTAIWMVDE